MNELNRPLGVKPDDRKGVAPVRRFNALGLVSLLVAVAALGLAGWLYLARQEPMVVAGGDAQAVSGQTRNGETAGNEDASDNSTEEEDAQDGDGNEESEGITGLTPVEPSGNIAVPEPRPPRAAPQEAGLAHLPDPELIERGATGVIPKRSADGRKPMDVYAREPDTTGNFGVARVVLIIGGIGISQTSSQEAVRKLPGTVTLAFAATGNSLARWMQEARKKGHELLLQVPMQAFGASSGPGSRILSAGASAEENLVNLHWAMSRITNYVGVMNYQGGKLLSEPGALKPVFDEIAERGLLFVDDGSSGANQSKALAEASLLPYARAHVLIDAKRTRQDIAGQLEALVKEAKRTGIAIGVSNGYSETIDMIAAFAKQANGLGVEITPVSAIVSDPERNR